MRDLTADLGDGGGELLGGSGDGLDALAGFGGGRTDHGSAAVGAFGGRGHRLGGGLELAGAGGHQADELADGGIEAVGERDQGVALLLLAAGLGGDLLGLERAGGQRRLAQDFEGLGHAADLVAAVGLLDRLVDGALGDLLHPVLLAVERAEHVAGDQPGQRRHQQHQAEADRGKLQRQCVYVGVDVVDIEAVADGHVPGREFAREHGLADRLGLAGAGIEIGGHAALRGLAAGFDNGVGDQHAVGILGAGDLAFELLVGAVRDQGGIGVVDDRVALTAIEAHAAAALMEHRLGLGGRQLAGGHLVLERLRVVVEELHRGPHLLDAVFHHAALAENGRYTDDGCDCEGRKANHAGELGADLQMAQQLHHSPYEMVVIARIGSMKFLPIMNIGAQKRAARKLRCSLVRNPATKSTTGVGAGRCGCRRGLVFRVGGRPVWQER